MKQYSFTIQLCIRISIFLSNIANDGDLQLLCRPRLGVSGMVSNDFMLVVVGLQGLKSIWAELIRRHQFHLIVAYRSLHIGLEDREKN